MRLWLMREGNAYWNERVKQWTSRDLATEFSDSEVESIELTGDAEWVCDYGEELCEGEV